MAGNAILGTSGALLGQLLLGVAGSASPSVSGPSLVNQGGTGTFAAMNFTGGAVTWSASAGSINSSGVFTAPTSAQAVTITATGVSNTGQTATFSVTIPAVVITIAPTSVSLALNTPQTFTATVTGTVNTAVTWSGNAPGGVYPGSAFATTATVTVTSVADGTKTASASVIVAALNSSLAVFGSTHSISNGTQAAGSVGYAIYSMTGTLVSARSTTGIVEIVPGSYVAQYAGTPPNLVVWDTSGVTAAIVDYVQSPVSSAGGATQSQVAAALAAGVNVTQWGGVNVGGMPNSGAVAVSGTVALSSGDETALGSLGAAETAITSISAATSAIQTSLTAQMSAIAGIPAATVSAENASVMDGSVTLKQAEELELSIATGKYTNTPATASAPTQSVIYYHQDGTSVLATDAITYAVVSGALANIVSRTCTFGTL